MIERYSLGLYESEYMSYGLGFVHDLKLNNKTWINDGLLTDTGENGPKCAV